MKAVKEAVQKDIIVLNKKLVDSDGKLKEVSKQINGATT